jgi:hypothetical protein
MAERASSAAVSSGLAFLSGRVVGKRPRRSARRLGPPEQQKGRPQKRPLRISQLPLLLSGSAGG